MAESGKTCRVVIRNVSELLLVTKTWTNTSAMSNPAYNERGLRG